MLSTGIAHGRSRHSNCQDRQPTLWGLPRQEPALKRSGRILLLLTWLVAVGMIAYPIAAGLDYSHLLGRFLEWPLASKIVVGVLVWLALMVAGWFLLAFLNERFGWDLGSEGPGFDLLGTYLVFWPPAWPVAVVAGLVLLVLVLVNRIKDRK